MLQELPRTPKIVTALRHTRIEIESLLCRPQIRNSGPGFQSQLHSGRKGALIGCLLKLVLRSPHLKLRIGKTSCLRV
jgi:hypothetical protein